MRRFGQAIGLFGGSFNPAHGGHLHAAQTGLTALALDEVWWMVSPQNPLKPSQPPYEQRVASVMALDLPPRMHISHMETEFKTQYTVDTVKAALRRWPGTQFVFLMGADNFQQLPKWHRWQDIMNMVPIAIIARPGRQVTSIRARLGKAAQIYRCARIAEAQAHVLKFMPPPAWTYLTPPLNPLSSSAIRAQAAKA